MKKWQELIMVRSHSQFGLIYKQHNQNCQLATGVTTTTLVG
jgi:hypothetical protein